MHLSKFSRLPVLPVAVDCRLGHVGFQFFRRSVFDFGAFFSLVCLLWLIAVDYLASEINKYLFK